MLIQDIKLGARVRVKVSTADCLKVKQDSRAAKWYYKNGYNHIIFEGDYEWLEKKLVYDEAKQ